MKGEKGTTLIETLVAVALLGIISSSFLSATATTSTARVNADEKASGKILAESLMEGIKKDAYTSSYNITVPSQFAGYNASVNVIENNNIQDITITVDHRGHAIFTLESYKVNRE
jgi:prepilin-type N-terminal cleavage/methylation domain-containing protein